MLHWEHGSTLSLALVLLKFSYSFVGIFFHLTISCARLCVRKCGNHTDVCDGEAGEKNGAYLAGARTAAVGAVGDG